MKSRSKVMFVLLVLSLALVMVSSVGAITYGQPDGNLHPNVGALLTTDRAGNLYPYCSGTLIAPQVFLTAAHCNISSFTGTDAVIVTFDTAVEIGVTPTTYSGTFVGNPLYSQRQNDPHDIAVVLLDTAPGLAAAQLPQAGQFDSLKQANKDQSFTPVGYGGEEPVPTPGQGIVIDYLDIRQYSKSSLNAVNDAWLRLSQNPSTGDSGTCYGDSGGPNFLGSGDTETSIVAAITITGDAICRATNVVYRLDTPDARAFLGQYVSLP
ncbi:MAG: trypsin-like serine protease [Anaerolineae bacterium]|nr:trypsin-like serine protease [Anaerolineae bacterium]